MNSSKACFSINHIAIGAIIINEEDIIRSKDCLRECLFKNIKNKAIAVTPIELLALVIKAIAIVIPIAIELSSRPYLPKLFLSIRYDAQSV